MGMPAVDIAAVAIPVVVVVAVCLHAIYLSSAWSVPTNIHTGPTGADPEQTVYACICNGPCMMEVVAGYPKPFSPNSRSTQTPTTNPPCALGGVGRGEETGVE